jgi:hypothetical protein
MTIGVCGPWVPLPKYIVAIPHTWGCPRDAGGECLRAKMSRQLWDADGAPARKEVVAAWTWGHQRRGSHVAQHLHAPVPPRSCQEGGCGSHAAEHLHELCLGRSVTPLMLL